MNTQNKEPNYITTNREGDVAEYDVPVISSSHENSDQSSISMGDRISSAKSEKEVEALLQKAVKSYKYASSKTMRRWKKVAQIRLNQLQEVKKSKETVSKPPTVTKKKSVSKKKTTKK